MEFAPAPTLVFPTSVSTLQQERGTIRSQLRDTYNRLHSIEHDADFVHDEVAPAFPDFPVVANQRAGAWYVKPEEEKAHAYFKSTDGHTGEHSFNLRRANLALLPLIKQRQGIILVDSTRRGKRFPDALSKTIPTWCAVLNRARVLLLPPDTANSIVPLETWQEEGKLFTSPQAVGRSEHSQIEKKIEGWAQDLAKSAYDRSSLLMLERPLRPFFVSPASTLTAPQSAASFTSTYPVICCSASKLAEEADGMERARGFSYVQGSGDDHEAWSKGLTPTIFWKHATEILMAGREEIDEVIARILLEEFSIKVKEESAVAAAPSSVATFSPIRSTNLSFAFAVDAASLPSAPSPSAPFITIAASKTASSSLPPMSAETGTAPQPIDLVVRPGKAGYAAFFDSSSNSRLSHALSAATNKLKSIEEVRVAVLKNEEGNQSEANDLGVAFALVLLTRAFDANAALLSTDSPTPAVTKDLIRGRLHWLLEVFPTVNPSRASLNKVNELLMSRR
ncbi:hypothetical protein JCM11641_007481 [Rhodosporidiobolus odoratus]